MGLDDREYMHPEKCQCPQCQYRKNHSNKEQHAGHNLTGKEWKKIIKETKKQNKKNNWK